MHHSTPLTCCIEHARQKRKGTKKRERKFITKKGGTPLHDFCESHYAHMVLTVMRQVQGPFD